MRILNKVIEIIEAWIISIYPSYKKQQIAEYRMSVCLKCDHIKQNETLIEFYYCGICNCPLNKKKYSPTKLSCPERKWKK